MGSSIFNTIWPTTNHLAYMHVRYVCMHVMRHVYNAYIYTYTYARMYVPPVCIPQRHVCIQVTHTSTTSRTLWLKRVLDAPKRHIPHIYDIYDIYDFCAKNANSRHSTEACLNDPAAGSPTAAVL